MAKGIKHNSRAHALLSASGASRWLNCTPSARLEEEYGVKKPSSFADEGTLAHEFCELYLRYEVLCEVSELEFTEQLNALTEKELFTPDMLDYVEVYKDFCADSFHAAQVTDKYATLYAESKLDLTRYVPEAFGTADCVIVANGTMEVIDFKYGKGVAVYAQANPQLMLYGLGALHAYEALYDIDTVRLTIVQPRIGNISSWDIAVGELLEWANGELMEKAELAYNGKGELSCGDWCRFCSVRTRCREQYEEQLRLSRDEFKDARLLTDTEIEEILRKASVIKSWLEDVQEYAKETALEGKEWSGFKLVEGRSVRKITDELAAANAIKAAVPELSDEDLYNVKLKGITDLERTLGKKKFAEILGGLVVKPAGSPTLVPVEDSRPALDASAQTKEDFRE